MNNTDVPDNHCYHCLLVIPEHLDLSVVIDNEARSMCCPGCAAVAQTIIDSGLDNYYRHRTINELPTSANARNSSALIPEELALYNNEKLQQSFVTLSDKGVKEATLVIEGITCAACIWLLEHHLQKNEGIASFNVNMTNHRAQISWDEAQISLSQILNVIHDIGYLAHPYRPDIEEQLLAKEHKRAMRRLGIAGVGMMQVSTLAIALYFGAFSGIEEGIKNNLRWISLIVCTPIVFYSARPFFQAALRDFKTRHLSMDVPVSIAIGSAYIASTWATVFSGGEVYFDSVSMFTFFLLFGRYLEMQARHRTGRAGNALQNLLPEAATKILTINDEVSEQLIAASDLEVGDSVLVKPGQTIPADGVITQGYSSIDESALTGEYLPQRRNLNENVIGGTINVENPLHIQITKIGAQTQLSAIVRLLERASEEKPAVAKIADTIANYFVAFVLLSALIVSISWYFIDPAQTFWITLSVLVVTCPCALSLATPTALTTATGTLRQQGLLITRSHVLENLSVTTDIVFDKTGTLTQGNLSIEKTVTDFEKAHALTIAAALEANSEHPIAQAFKPYLQQSANNLEVTLGQGIQGVYKDKTYRIGKASFASSILKSTVPIAPDDHSHWLLLCDDQQVIAWFSIDDTLRPDSQFCIDYLTKADINVHMLTGDSSSSADTLAGQLGIKNVCKGASPEDKIRYITELQKENLRKVVMVGDGINDLPVLAGAQTSIAMGSASDLAKTHADAVLTKGELAVIVSSLVLAKKTKRIIKQNIGWAIGYNFTALPLAAFGLIPPWAAAIGMSLSSLIVVTNALRLSSKKAQVNFKHKTKNT
jgi:Cu2+-exporting ATPase